MLKVLIMPRADRVLCLLIGLVFVSCGVEKERAAACSVAVKRAIPLSSVMLSDLSSAFFSAGSSDQMSAFLEDNPALRFHFFEQTRYLDLAYLSESLSKMIQNPHLDTLRKEVSAHYGDLSELRQQLAIAWGSLQVYDTSFVTPSVQTIVSGLYKDLYLSDSLVIVGLDYFIGPSARYPPRDVPFYLLRRLSSKHLVPTLLFYFSERYNKTNISDQTLLSDMVAMGKTYAFVQQMLPCVPDSTLLGYTPTEMRDVKENEHTIWAYFLHNQLLYETSPRLKKRFVGERPKVYEIDEKCPGRIGHWLGWQIVRAYLGRQEGSGTYPLKTLMTEEDAKKILTLSKYNPSS